MEAQSNIQHINNHIILLSFKPNITNYVVIFGDMHA